MQKGNLSRRGFLQRVFTAAVASGLPAWYAQEIVAQQAKKNDPKKPVSPGQRIGVGLIGCGGRGQKILGDARKINGVQCLAVCDVDKTRRESTAQQVGKDCKAHADFRALLDQANINAVLIATPDHWHTLIALQALRKGKDVYCEKPLTLTVQEGQVLVKAAAKAKRIFQVGSQQRSDKTFRLACELVRNGRLGKIDTIHTMIGVNQTGGPFPTSQPPEGLDWDFWLGQTPKVDYIKERCHHSFRWWYEYSGGKMTDWGAHHNDIAQWALGMDASGPTAVEATGQAPSRDPASFNVHPTFKVTYTYDNKTRVICTGDDDKKNGVRFEGEGGKWLFVARGNKINASDRWLIEEPLPGGAVRLEASDDHMANWINGIRNRKVCVCPVEVGHRSASVCHIGVIALRTGKKLRWDPAKELFDDEDANRMLSRPVRAPWKLE